MRTTIRSFVRASIDRLLNRHGYALRRIQIEDAGWEEVVRRAGDGIGDRRPLVLDIGAHEGAFSAMILARWPEARIFAFEPIPELSPSLAALARRHPGFSVMPVALGENEADEVEFNVHESSVSSSLLSVDPAYARLYPDQARLSRKIRVRVRRLDDWAAENGLESQRIDVAKIDVQGFEDRVIAGGESTFRRTRYLVTEGALYPSYAGGVMLDELCARLRALGFELIWGFNVFGASADLFWKNSRSC